MKVIIARITLTYRMCGFTVFISSLPEQTFKLTIYPQ
jgi:hypothetical protein